jgi:hypothetical protein
MDGFALDSFTQLVPQGALRDQVHAPAEQVFEEELQTHVVAERCRASEGHQQVRNESPDLRARLDNVVGEEPSIPRAR